MLCIYNDATYFTIGLILSLSSTVFQQTVTLAVKLYVTLAHTMCVIQGLS